MAFFLLYFLVSFLFLFVVSFLLELLFLFFTTVILLLFCHNYTFFFITDTLLSSFLPVCLPFCCRCFFIFATAITAIRSISISILSEGWLGEMHVELVLSCGIKFNWISYRTFVDFVLIVCLLQQVFTLFEACAVFIWPRFIFYIETCNVFV